MVNNRKDRPVPGYKTKEELEKDIKTVIDKHLDGNLQRFLRKHYKQSRYERVCSKTIVNWLKDKEAKKAVGWIIDNTRYPKHLVDVVNIARTLEMYYGKEINKKTIKIAYNIWDLLEIPYIYPYCIKRYSRGIAKNGFRDRQLLPKGLAFREQKARGFIHVNDFEEYDRKGAHIFSNVNRNYIWPENFKSSVANKQFNTNIYIAHTLIGVQGWTSIVTP